MEPPTILNSWERWSGSGLPLPKQGCSTSQPCPRPGCDFCALRLEHGGILPTSAENGEVWPELRWIKPKTDEAISPFSHLTAAITPSSTTTSHHSEESSTESGTSIKSEAAKYEENAMKELQRAVREGDCTRWNCPVYECSASYQFKNDLKHHLRKKHPDRNDLARIVAPDKSSKVGKKFPCPHEECTSGFHWQRDLRRHLMMRHGPPENAILMKRKRRPPQAPAHATDEESEPRELHDNEPQMPNGYYQSMLLDGSFDHLPESFI